MGEGYATVTTYLSGIFDSQRGKIYNVASVKIDENGVFDHASLKVRSNGDKSSYSSAMIINEGKGYVFSDGTFSVYDLETMDVLATLDSTKLYAHGSMAISTGHPGKVYAYIVPYVESPNLMVVEHDLRTNNLTLSYMENVAISQYCSQQVHFLEDGGIVYTNDRGILYCIRHNVAVSSISFDEKAKAIGIGEEYELEVNFNPSNAGIRTLEWSTSDSSVAAVKNGTVTGVSFGTAVITATSSNGRTATCTITVGDPTISVTSVSLDKNTASAAVGDTVTLTATVSPSNATDRSVTWSTSDSNVATVSNGVVKVLSAGTATITVTTADGGYTDTCTLTVESPSYTITWKNWDGSVLSTTAVDKGVVPSYEGIPSRASDERYAYKGAPTLNDGVLGRGRHESGRWLGFYGAPLDAVIDMEELTEIRKVGFRALVTKGSWIYNPSHVRILVSDVGDIFSEVAQKDIPITTWTENDGIYPYELDFNPITARYVEIVITGHDLPEDHSGYGNPAWIFIDEIEAH